MSKQIPLSRGLFATVDDEDFEWLSQWRWTPSSRCGLDRNKVFCAIRFVMVDGKQRTILMHREITNAPNGMVVDHIDRDPLNNCRANLRVCTHSQNLLNRFADRGSLSKFKGVVRDERDGRWAARFRAKHIGMFATEEEAARAYDNAALAFSPEFALTNFLPDGTPRPFEEPTVIVLPRETSSSHRGVCWHKKSQSWQARGRANGARVNLGFFDTEEEAALTVERFYLEGAK